MNSKKLVRELKLDPLDDLVERLQQRRGDSNRYLIAYQLAYRHYALAGERMIQENSVARRFRNGAYYALKYGHRYTPAERRIATKFRPISRFLEHDFVTLILFTRILLDRTIGLSRFFVPSGNAPSFSSFNEHRKFYIHKVISNATDTVYGEFVRLKTAWLSDSLKRFRDRGLVHNDRAPFKFLGSPSTFDIGFMYLLPEDQAERDRLIGSWKTLTLSELLAETRTFLKGFNSSGLRSLGLSERSPTAKARAHNPLF